LKTTNGGVNWVSQTSGTTYDLRSVYFVSTTTGWTVGLSGKIIKTTNGGTNWTSQSSGISNDLYSVYFITSDIGWVVGNSGKILKTTNAGTNWATQTSGTAYDLRSVCIIQQSLGKNLCNNENNNVNRMYLHNYPNPFNPTTVINYSIPEVSYVELKVYDILGNEVANLVSDENTPGNYNVVFDASLFSSGVYIYTLKTNNYFQTKKMMLIK